MEQLGMGYPSLLYHMARPDLSHYTGREHAYIKHYLLEKYLSRWAYKIGSTWDTLVFIDGFAGPWGAKDSEFADASFGIAVRALNDAVAGLLSKRQRTVRGVCIFVENKPKPFGRLDDFARTHSTESVRAMALKGRFTENIQKIDEEVGRAGSNPFKFVFLDQKGWAATPMARLKPFVRARPCELLFNLMTSFLTRFVDNEELASSYHALYGRPGVLEKIRALPKKTGQREETAVEEYCKSLRDVCGFRYVSRAVVMDSNKERVRYFLVFATNSLHGIEVFKDAEASAAETQDEVRHFAKERREGPFLPFGGPPPQSAKVQALKDYYIRLLNERVVRVLATERRLVVPYKELYGLAMALPLVTADELERILKALEPHIRIQLDGVLRKKPSPFKNDQVVISNPKGLGSLT